MKNKTEEARGWGLRIGGPRPYLAWRLTDNKADIKEVCNESFHRPVRVVLLPLAEYRRLKRLERYDEQARD